MILRAPSDFWIVYTISMNSVTFRSIHTHKKQTQFDVINQANEMHTYFVYQQVLFRFISLTQSHQDSIQTFIKSSNRTVLLVINNEVF